MTKRAPNTVVFYHGPSQLTGAPILGFLTGLQFASRNTKTGDMLQVYILQADMNPSEAVKTGADTAICGDCTLRSGSEHGRGCYVAYWQAPLRVWSSWRNGHVPTANPIELRHHLRGQQVRVSAYGDPVALPLQTLTWLLSKAGGWTGYTQQWRTCDPGFKSWLMASCHNEDDQAAASARGWHTYRTRTADDPLVSGEIVCPASAEAGHKITCAECRVCQGSNAKRPNAAIMVHGRPGNLTAFWVRPMRWHRAEG